ncbi:GDSL-type esterase/lipase family protein [Gilvimarinus sp. DA14]|uniref:GDSL-type esterase/lipase family protein n=1 Tax=Gilvimarinus sp. DA14 TaxID=2956798 RepID=UPI0020B8D08B|nr:GDSL-type esterase/lipase family protein [Gilvimarinus sp. DA14]UTF59162.1 GDSL-type esterase/lipase family protein [Gilvimarinus sp. DA14]
MRLIINTALTLALFSHAAFSDSQTKVDQLQLWPVQSGNLVAQTHDQEKLWQGSDLTLGDERRVMLSRSKKDALIFQWQDAWWSAVRFETNPAANLEPFRENGGVVFTLQLEQFDNAGFDVAYLCGNGCERKVTLTHQVKALLGKGPQTLKLPASCLMREQDNAGYIKTPLRFGAGGSGKAIFSSVSWQRDLQSVEGITLSCPDQQTVAITPAPLNEHWAQSWWMPRHKEKLKQARENNPEVIFLGDSITEGWEKSGADVFEKYFGDYRTLNLGYGGDRTENVLWRLQHGEVDETNPKLVVLMIGTNNTGHRQDDPARIAEGIKHILAELEQRVPDSKVLLLAIYPRGATADDVLRKNNALVNARIRNFADGERVFFKDINSIFLTEDGVLSEKVMPDLLHPEEYGYTLVAEAIKDDIERLTR